MKFLFVALCAVTFALPAAAQESDLLSMYQGYSADSQQAIDQPHRSISEMENWVSDTVAVALEFRPGDAANKLAAIKPYFTDAGYRSYVAFLQAQGYSDALRTQTLNLTTIVNSAPLLIGQGASAGRYAWAFELPVILSTQAQGAVDPATGNPTPSGRNATLRIQAGRNAQAANDAGILIESWQEYKEPAASEPTQETSGKPAGTP